MEDGVQEVCLVSIFFDRRCLKPVLQSCNPAGFAGPVILFLIGESTPQPGTAEKPVPFHLPVETLLDCCIWGPVWIPAPKQAKHKSFLKNAIPWVDGDQFWHAQDIIGITFVSFNEILPNLGKTLPRKTEKNDYECTRWEERHVDIQPHRVKVLKMYSSTQKSLGIMLHNYGIYPWLYFYIKFAV